MIVRERLEGQSVAWICVQDQISRKVFYYWWMTSFQDDHSRFITSSVKVWDPTGETRYYCLKRLKKWGAPEQVLTDQGTPFKPTGGETSDFARLCQDLGIEHITASKRRPTTIGKIEAFHKAYENEATYSANTGASYATTTTNDHTKH